MPPRVIVAHNRYRSDLPSGENRVVEQEMRWLAAAGVDVAGFIRDSDTIAALPWAEKALLPLAPIWAPRAQRELAEMIAGHRPDAVHLHNPYPLISPWIIRTAHRFGVPVVQTVHNYRHVCASGVYFRDGHICHDCRGRRLALPAIRHACYRGSTAQSAAMAAALAVHRGTWRAVDLYLAPSQGIAEHLRGFGIDPARIVVKPNAVDDPGPPDPPGVGVLFAGRLSPEKGIGLLLRVWPASLGRVRVAGDGPLRRLVSEHPQVEYLGHLDPAGVRAAIRAAALVAVPSIVDDVQPTIVLEALANGRAVVGTTRGGIAELIGDAGWAVPPAELGAILPVAVSEAASRGARARERYLQHFHPSINVARLIEVYGSLRRP